MSAARAGNGSLTPELALAYLRELSPAVTEAALVDAGGRVLAGDPQLAAGEQSELVVVGADDARLVARVVPGVAARLARLDAQIALDAARKRV